MKKVIITSTALLLILIGVIIFWPSHKQQSNSDIPPVTRHTNEAQSTDPTPVVDNSSDTLTAQAPSTPTPSYVIYEADSSSYPTGMVNTAKFQPTGQWGIDFSYSGTSDVSVRVINALTGLPVNFVVSTTAPQASQFSFLELPPNQPVYLEIRATNWHVKVIDITAGGQISYKAVIPQTERDWDCEAFLPHCQYTPDPVL